MHGIRRYTDGLPLLTIGWRGETDAFGLNDGNHRWEVCRQLGTDAFMVILWCHEDELPGCWRSMVT